MLCYLGTELGILCNTSWKSRFCELVGDSGQLNLKNKTILNCLTLYNISINILLPNGKVSFSLSDMRREALSNHACQTTSKYIYNAHAQVNPTSRTIA